MALSSQETDNILKDITKLTKFDDNNYILNNIEGLKKEIRKLGATIEKNLKIYESGKNVYYQNQKLRSGYTISTEQEGGIEANYFKNKTRFKIETSQKELEKAIAKAYILIMKIREVLFNETIEYSIYVDMGDNKENVQNIILNDKTLLEVISFNNHSKEMKINNITLKNFILNNKNNNSEGISFNDEKDTAYNSLMNEVKNKDLEKVQSYWRIKYYKISNLLKNKGEDKDLAPYVDNFLKQPNKHGKRFRIKFNEGHLAEAFDIAWSKKSINSLLDLRIEFFKNLKYDNIKATRGADNAEDLDKQYSVKAFNASVYNYATVYGDLVQMYEILSEQNIEQNLKHMFIDEAKYSSFANQMNIALDDIVTDKINKAIQKLGFRRK